MSIEIGPVTLQDPVVLAPMSGVSDRPFRRIVRRYGAGLVVSEMIASDAMLREVREELRKAEIDADDAPAVVKAVPVPVTLKMRTGWDESDRNAPRLARIAEDAGIRMITVHGRTRCQMYNGRADWEFIRQVKDVVRIPVVANGDITTPDEAVACLAQSGADGVMIGRGACGRPWLLRQVADRLAGRGEGAAPSIAEMKTILVEHLEGMLSHYGVNAGLRNARKHVGWYSQGLPDSAGFRQAVNNTVEPQRVFAAIDRYFDPLIERRAA